MRPGLFPLSFLDNIIKNLVSVKFYSSRPYQESAFIFCVKTGCAKSCD